MSILMRIRSIARSDFRKWKVLWDGYNPFYGRHGDTALPQKITRWKAAAARFGYCFC
ncbi:hypothetical protein ACFSHT_33630 [Paraburkholderia silviterrae]|uniref:hypothetical protein n=1 Tax=Paraburkholderia silviterrae TaxID=2528715 RepID=UPI001404C6E2|nr:hypothetical protein [Paraburkholderia silviterrae]